MLAIPNLSHVCPVENLFPAGLMIRVQVVDALAVSSDGHPPVPMLALLEADHCGISIQEGEQSIVLVSSDECARAMREREIVEHILWIHTKHFIILFTILAVPDFVLVFNIDTHKLSKPDIVDTSVGAPQIVQYHFRRSNAAGDVGPGFVRKPLGYECNIVYHHLLTVIGEIFRP